MCGQTHKVNTVCITRIMNLMFRFFILVLALCFSNARERATGGTRYSSNFLKTLSDCDNYKNTIWDVSGLTLQQDSQQRTYLTGSFEVKSPIGVDGNVEIVLEIYKEGMLGREFYNLLSANFCQHVSDTDVPWTSIFMATGMKSCPIEPKVYPVEKMELNIDSVQDYMQHEYVGEYYTKLILNNVVSGPGLAPKQISCHAVTVAVTQSKVEET